MRSICKNFTFHEETLFIAVMYLDRYLSLVKVTMRKQYNLLAVTSVYMAAKYFEEIKEPCSSDMAETSPDGHTLKDVRRMERKLTLALDWRFNVVTPHVILF
jgi:hypothetical protein